MKRVLCGLAVAAATFAAVPAHASEAPVQVGVTANENGAGAGASYGTNGHYQPLGGAFVNTSTGVVCFGLSYQVPQCTPPVSVVLP
ncbi:MAG: hypothetical protein QOE45_2135 [Frankiaceae bacterium]|jgi:hypothetical protein|nr:hypothetical protein [Frankiaceae bacterium]